jgi:hypothetical protein
MRHLTISELVLLSDKDRKARRIRFDAKRTILLGSNQTGKSSIVKSICHALGAEPAKQHQRWVSAEVKSLIKFSVDGVASMLLRDGSFFSVFDGEGRFIESFSSITRGLGPYLAAIFDFKLILASRDQNPEIPPPAFLYLPFYIDQDAGWQNPWSSFNRLQQYSQWKTSVAEYHAGARDNLFYELQAKSLDLARDLNIATQQSAGLRSVMKTLQDEAIGAMFDLNPEVFGQQVERLLHESQRLLAQENELKEQLAELNGQRAIQKNRLDIATRALGEITEDFNFLSRLPKSEIECPTCGTEYTNDFAVRFAIATDEDRVAGFIEHIRSEILQLDNKISDLYSRYRLSQESASRIQDILAEKQGEVTLDLIIENEGRKAADNLLRSQLEAFEEKRNAIAVKAKESDDDLKAHKSRLASTEEAVLKEYTELLRANLFKLEVRSLSYDAYQELAPPIREIGSSLPRTLLAYYFAIIGLAAIRSPSTVCPIVIDSPNQQAQDDHGLGIMLRFIADQQPAQTQMILAIEKTMGVEMGGSTIELEDKYSVLNQTDYEFARAEITSLVKSSIGS